MIFLITNDDGIGATGLDALCRALPGANRTVVVAPAAAVSECGHRVTTKDPLRVDRLGADRFAVHGTPADCVRIAVRALLERPPDAVLSGINEGGNLGADIYISGTVAAAREAAFLGLPSMAVSHYRKHGLSIDWEWACRQTATVIAQFLAAPPVPGEYWNVNLPHLDPSDDPEPAGIRFCPPCTRPLPVGYCQNADGHYAYSGVYSARDRIPGSDVDHCFSGHISISRLRLEHHWPTAETASAPRPSDDCA
ncbi:MAG TPA: 5'/3'-nucleotidase SurE [Verrucomicrobiales bacterium]|nr:5'/3'-nucleotidase SurE [Verrucomicrobiales bacterium]